MTKITVQKEMLCFPGNFLYLQLSLPAQKRYYNYTYYSNWTTILSQRKLRHYPYIACIIHCTQHSISRLASCGPSLMWAPWEGQVWDLPCLSKKNLGNYNQSQQTDTAISWPQLDVFTRKWYLIFTGAPSDPTWLTEQLLFRRGKHTDSQELEVSTRVWDRL